MIFTSYLPFFILVFLVWRAARSDGRIGVMGRSHAIVRHQGVRPAFDPVNNRHHAQVERDKRPDPQLPTWKAHLERIEEHLTQLVSLPWLLLATFALLVVEYLSDNQILRGIGGFSDLRRALISAGMAVALFVLAEVLARLSTQRTWLFWTFMLVATVIVFSITVVTLDGVTDDGTSLPDIGLAIILALTVVGPAALNVLVAEQLRVLLPLRRERALNRRYIAQADAKVLRAEAFERRLARWAAWWDQRVVRLESRYTYVFTRAAVQAGIPLQTVLALLASEESLVPKPRPSADDDEPLIIDEYEDQEPPQRALATLRVPNPYRQFTKDQS